MGLFWAITVIIYVIVIFGKKKGEVCRYLYLNYDVQLLNAPSMVLVEA